jgi:hypothetical protein
MGRAGEHNGRRAVRVAAVVVALVAAVVVGGDAGAVVRAARGSGGRAHDGAVADRLPRVPLGGGGLLGLIGEGAGFDALGARLRLPDAAPVELASDAVASSAVAGAVAAPSPLAAPPARTEVAITPPPRSAFGGGAPVAAHAAPTRYGDVTPSGGTWALLVGINDYPGTQYDLRSAVNDVQDVDEALRRAGVTADRRMLLRDGDATSGKIRGGLDWLASNAGADATIVLFYAGHVQKLGDRTEALVGSDGGVVADTEVAEYLDRSPAARGWIGIAACYAAGFDEVVRPGRILTAAAGAGSLAYESSTFGRSYLVEYMVRRAMLTDGITSVEGAFARGVDELQREHPDRMPVQIDDVDGDLDLRTSGAPAAPASGGAPPQASPPSTEPDGCARLTVGVVRCSH